MQKATFSIRRGGRDTAEMVDYQTEVTEGMVVLDAVHQIQAESAPDLACRWNCKAGKCGSCSAEINGMPKLMCMTRLDTIPLDQPVTIEPMRAFPPIKDLITDVSWNYEVKKRIKKFNPRKPDAEDGTWRMVQEDIDRVQEFRKCIECYLCQDVCHVLRDHEKHQEFIGPRFLVYLAALEMHPLDTEDRTGDLKDLFGIGYCNITKCCTKVCPEGITITDNAIIPLKERVVDEHYDPLKKIGKVISEEMKYVEKIWEEKRKRGLKQFLLFDGILITGGPFAVVMQAVGFFFLRDEGQTFGQYFSSSRTWITFFFHATLFGLIMGMINWFRNEKVHRSKTDSPSTPEKETTSADD